MGMLRLLGAVGLSLMYASISAAAGEGEQDRCDGTGKGAFRSVELQGRHSTLVLFGDRHQTDPADPVFADIEQRVAELRPTIILVEGGLGPPETQRDVAIAHGGFLCWLAAQRKVPCQSMDLSEVEEVRRLVQRHPRDEVLMFLVARVLAYFNGRPLEQRPPGNLVEWAVRRYRDDVGLPEATPADVAAAFERLLHRPWKPDELTTEIHDPRKSELVTQRMSQESNELREPYMLERLLAAAESGARVFATVGEGHLCRLQTELRARWKASGTGPAGSTSARPASDVPLVAPARPSASAGTP